MYGIGTDIVIISRVIPWLDDNAMLDYVFTQKEVMIASKKRSPHKYFASIFAVKEAFMKAIGTGWGNGVSWKDIEVFFHEKNTASIELYNKTKEFCKGKRVFVSTSCEDTVAVALVVVSAYE